MNPIDINNAKTIKKISREIIEYLVKHPNTKKQKITNNKGQIGKKYNYSRVIKNATILSFATDEEKKVITPILKRRTTRTDTGSNGTDKDL